MQPKEVELNLKYHTIGTNLQPVCTTYLNVPSELQKASVCFVLSFPTSPKLGNASCRYE